MSVSPALLSVLLCSCLSRFVLVYPAFFLSFLLTFCLSCLLIVLSRSFLLYLSYFAHFNLSFYLVLLSFGSPLKPFLQHPQIPQEATAIQKRLDQWKDWLENGIEKKAPKKPVYKAPRRGRNVFANYDPSRYEEEAAAFVPNKGIKTPTAAFASSFTPVTSRPNPDPVTQQQQQPVVAPANLIQYPTMYPGLATAGTAAVAKPTLSATPIGGPGLVSYPVIGANLFPVVGKAASKTDERDAISEMFDL